MAVILAVVLLVSWVSVGLGRNLSSTLPAASVVISPADDIQSAVNSNPPGTTFFLKAGVHRLQSVTPQNGDTFTGEDGAILSGAKLLTSFQRQGSYWVATGKTQQGLTFGECLPAFPMCGHAEDLFIDDAPLQHAATLADVGPGKWYFDYGAAKIYFADDPTGHKLETSVTVNAFNGPARNVTVRGLVIEKYADPAQTGAIHGADGQGWVIENNEIRLNHGAGVRTGNKMSVRGNYVHHNGQMGVEGGGDSVLVEGNQIAFNNFAGYLPTWEAGGTKFAFTNNLVVRNNYVHNNNGPGLWTDIQNRNTLYEYNHTETNKGAGIQHEISFAATIRYNTIENEAPGVSGGDIWAGAAINIVASSDVEVYGNNIVNSYNGIAAAQQDRGSDPSGTPFLVKNLNVHDNTIVQTVGYAAGIVTDLTNNDVFTAWNNRFDRNTYRLGSLGGRYFAWLGGPRTKDEWQAFGKDVNGVFALCSSGGTSWPRQSLFSRSDHDLRPPCAP